MRNIRRSTIAVVLIAALAMPAAAAGQSRRPGIVHAVRRFVIRVISRISPPGGVQEPVPEDSTTTTTDAPTTTKTQ